MSRRLIDAAQQLFRKHPFLTNSAIYGTLYVSAEFSQQLFKKRLLVNQAAKAKQDIDYATIGRFAVMGTVIYAPSLYIWYKWLDHSFPGTARITIVKKLMLDQFVLTPCVLTVFYTGMSLMEGADDPLRELREKFVPTFMRSCVFWLPAQTLNFYLVAPRFRVIYMGVCGFIWVNILCYLKRERVSKKPVDTNCS